MTPKQILTAARLAGGTPYTNRHYPDQTAMAFSHAKLMGFVAAIKAHTREECAKVVEQEIRYGTAYEYVNHNLAIKLIADKIRGLK